MPKQINRDALSLECARRSFGLFGKAEWPDMVFSPLHLTYYRILQAFADGRIRRLIITMPPQHGKSKGSTWLLPAYMLGRNPNLRIAIASYSDTFAKQFNREIQRLIDSDIYRTIFPETRLNGSGGNTKTREYIRTASMFEIVGKQGSLKAVGRGGGLTGNPVDVMILDDLYKDAMEGNSPIVREAVYEWYSSVVRTRLHNNSQELIVFTRWHEDDLIGTLEKNERVVEIKSFADIHNLPQGYDVWAKINFDAIKESEPTELDPRANGQPLWADRHSLEMLLSKRKLDPHTFECLYQGRPASKEGLLYSSFQTYDQLPSADNIRKRGAYIDTADTGVDYLCAISYVVDKVGDIFVTDVVYTQEAMELTEGACANMLLRNDCKFANIESNNGGRGFARAVQRLAPSVRVDWFHQSGNKEARIITNAPSVMQRVKFPADWPIRWPSFHQHLVTFKRIFRANTHDDCADALTGIIEKEQNNKGKYNIRVL